MTASHYPVETAGSSIRGIFLMDTLRGADSIDIVLKNYLGLFRALRNQPVHYVILVTFDLQTAEKEGIHKTDFMSWLDDFSRQLGLGLAETHTMEFRMLSTAEMCQLLAQAVPNPDCLDCDNLQYLSIFAQDPFIALRYEPGFLTMLSSVVSPVAFSYSFVAGAIASGAPPYLRLSLPTRFSMAGGNVLGQRDWAIVGMDTLDDNTQNDYLEIDEKSMPAKGFSRKRLKIELARQLGVQTIFATGTRSTYPQSPYFQQGVRQPVYHIDFYLTPAGTCEDPVTGELQELIFVGKLETFQTPDDQESKEIILRMKLGLEEAAAYFSRKTTPAGLKFRVVRLPLLLVGTTLGKTIVNSVLSFNQVLVQLDGDQKTVLMPDYLGPEGGTAAPEYAPWQQAAIEIYEQEGFRVEMVYGRYRDYSFYNGGSLHCIAKVIERAN